MQCRCVDLVISRFSPFPLSPDLSDLQAGRLHPQARLNSYKTPLPSAGQDVSFNDKHGTPGAWNVAQRVPTLRHNFAHHAPFLAKTNGIRPDLTGKRFIIQNIFHIRVIVNLLCCFIQFACHHRFNLSAIIVFYSCGF